MVWCPLGVDGGLLDWRGLRARMMCLMLIPVVVLGVEEGQGGHDHGRASLDDLLGVVEDRARALGSCLLMQKKASTCHSS